MAKIVVRDTRTVEAAFCVVLPQSDTPAEEVIGPIIDPIIEKWRRIDQANHTVTPTGEEAGRRRIIVQLARSTAGNNVRRPAIGASQELKVALEQEALPVNPSVVRSYSDIERLADTGLPDAKPAGGVV